MERRGCFKECTMLSGARTKNSDHWMGKSHGPKIEIDYDKLKELCGRSIPKERHAQSAMGFSRDDHNHFMTAYSSIFKRRRCLSLDCCSRPRIHTCTPTYCEPRGDIAASMIAIHGREKKEQEVIDLNERLREMLLIARKLPIQRTRRDVKELAQHLTYFDYLFPSCVCPLVSIVTGLASRIYVEEISKQGYSLPDQSGVYLILQGTVEKLSMDPETKTLTSDILYPGDTFGSLEGGQDVVFKNTYPMYMSSETCTLLRITKVDYNRVLQGCVNASASEKEVLLQTCSLLYGVSPSTLNKLSSSITWETVTNDTIILNEGETITKVGIIQNGKCSAYAQVPHTTQVQVKVGELGPGDCIGEVLLKGLDVQSYKIVSTSSKTRIGWISLLAVKVSEVEKHILSDREFSLPKLSKDNIRNMYADKILHRQWTKLRGDIVKDVRKERGIMLGMSKWKHN